MSELRKVSRREMEEFIFGCPISTPEQLEEDDREYFVLEPEEVKGEEGMIWQKVR